MKDHDEALDGSSHMRFDPRFSQTIMVEWEDGSLTPYVGPSRYASSPKRELRIKAVHVGAPTPLPTTVPMKPNKFLNALLGDIPPGGSS